MNQCPKCGALVLITQGFECPECGQFTCDSCFDEATGMCTACAAGRTAANESYDGITVQENSCPNVEECEIALNECNIYGHKRAPGIMAGDNADPHITACDIHDNIEGIWTINGKGKYTDCKVHDNVRHGIHIKDTATPYISGSICNSNNWSGISIAGGANATFHQCTVRDNGRNDGDKGNPQPGVIALEAAKLHMSSCEIKNNAWYGIQLMDEASCTLRNIVIVRAAVRRRDFIRSYHV